MKAYEIADTFRAAFAGDATFTGKTVAVAQTGIRPTRPSITFECTSLPMNASGSALNYTLHAWVESNADKAVPTDPDPGIAHGALVDAVRAKLVGTGKSTLLDALNALAVFDFRGWSASQSEPAISDLHFRTPISIAGTLLVL